MSCRPSGFCVCLLLVGWGAISLREPVLTLWVPQGYMQPLKQPENSLLCDPSLVDEIFDQIPELLAHHEQFLEQVRHCVQTWHAQQKVGDLLVQSVSGPAVYCYSPHKLWPLLGGAGCCHGPLHPSWRLTLIPDPTPELDQTLVVTPDPGLT